MSGHIINYKCILRQIHTTYVCLSHLVDLLGDRGYAKRESTNKNI